jgi:integrase
MSTTKLTKAAIERIKAPDPSRKQVIHWDADPKGFGVLASGKTTAKTYIVQRRLPDGRTRRLTVGAVGEFEKPEDARKKAGELLQLLRAGKDPKTERKSAAARDRTLRAALELYLKTNKELRHRSVEEYQRSVTRHLEPWLDRPLRELTREMVEERYAEIGREAGPAAANNAMRALRALWNDALDRDGTLPANPVRVLKKNRWFKLPSRTRMVRANDLLRFYRAIDELPNRTAGDFLKTVLFTGFRRREAAALRWEDEVDFATRVLRLPAARAKADRKLDLPMTSFVRDLLVARRALGNDNGWVFGADSRSGHIEEPKFALGLVAEATGIRVSVHDLRRTFITIAESTDISPYALKALVNHSLGNDVTSGYVQITVERLREPAQQVCEKMMELCGIKPPEGIARIGDRA